ncbi:MAG: hypothetical protein EOP35_21580 [Rubrivivax sp.]|nr:MAG: hypothetical protein EOP35_21580 [Rubrivivax sp.]
MKTLLTTAALAIAFLAPAAEARVAKHQDSHASATVKAKTGKKAGKAKHKKHAKKASHKTGL